MPYRKCMKAVIAACIALSLTACASTREIQALRTSVKTLASEVKMLAIDNERLNNNQMLLHQRQEQNAEQAKIRDSRIDTLEHSLQSSVLSSPAEQVVVKTLNVVSKALHLFIRPLAFGSIGLTANIIKAVSAKARKKQMQTLSGHASLAK